MSRQKPYPISDKDWAVYVTAQMGGVRFEQSIGLSFRAYIGTEEVTTSIKRLVSKGWLATDYNYWTKQRTLRFLA